MAGKTSKPPEKSKRRVLKPHPHQTTSSSSKSLPPPQIVLQQNQQTTHIILTPANASAIDWASLLGLAQSDLNRATISNFSSFPPVLHNAIATPQPLQSKPPTDIMTSIRGIPLSSYGTSAHPSLINQTVTSIPNHPFLRRKPNPTRRFIPWPHPSSAAPPRQSPAPPPIPQPSTFPQPFTPSTVHWRALRDVAFVCDGHFHLTPHDLCALLSYRYASADPQMRAVTVEQVGAMWKFVMDWREGGGEGVKGLYEGEARKLIGGEMGRDLKRLRLREGEGGLGGGI